MDIILLIQHRFLKMDIILLRQHTNKSFGVGFDSDDLHPLVLAGTAIEHPFDVRPHPQNRAYEHVVGLPSQSVMTSRGRIPAPAMPVYGFTKRSSHDREKFPM